MAVWELFTSAVYAIGILTAMVVLLAWILGLALILYGVRHFDEWEEKW